MNLFHGYICFYLFHLQQSTHSQCQILAQWSTFPKYLYILAQRKYIYIYIYIYIYPNSESTIFNLILYTISEMTRIFSRVPSIHQKAFSEQEHLLPNYQDKLGPGYKKKK